MRGRHYLWVIAPLLAVLVAAGCGRGVPPPTGATSSSLPPTSSTLSITTTSASSSSITTPPTSSTVLPPTSTTTGTTVTTEPGSVPVITPDGQIVLSPSQAAGQRVIYSYPGLTPPAELLSLIRKGQASGIIFFSENISGAGQIRSVIGQFEQANESPSNPVRAPLLLVVDQEGGEVRRLAGAPLLSEKQIGVSDDAAAEATDAGRQAGLNLRSAGMNVNLAPVLDVYRQSGDFIDKFGRSYSSDPELVSSLAADFIHAQQAEGILAVAKHFPGLGSATATQDTDQRPVTLKVSLESLRDIDEFPYRAALDAGAELVMVSWAVYPALDGSLPAGLSTKVVQDELRGRFDFQGVTVTDALAAGALKSFGTVGARAVLAAQAGMDLMLGSARDVAEGLEIRDALAEALSDGGLEQAAFQESVQRLVTLRFGLAP